jgi:hypothetical protein
MKVVIDRLVGKWKIIIKKPYKSNVNNSYH